MLKIGVLGAGNLGKQHISLLQDSDKYSVEGFYDSDRKVAAETEIKFGIKSFSSLHELIHLCDVIDITTPSSSHFEIAQKALKNSRHIFIGKSPEYSRYEAKSLTRLAGEANVTIQVSRSERFNPAFLASKEFICEPLFIEANRLVMFNPASTEKSVVHDLMIHDIDIVLSLVKANIRHISATGFAVANSTPDIANARIEFDNGTVANLTANRISFTNNIKSRFFTSGSFITVNYFDETANIVRMKNSSNNYSTRLIVDNGITGQSDNFTFENVNIANANALKMELDSFADSIINDERPAVSLYDGFKAMDAANKIAELLRLNANFAAATISA